MVIIKMIGGLGNQMFQYALARTLSLNNREVFLDCSGYEVQAKRDTLRRYELDKFGLNPPKVDKKQLVRYNNRVQYVLNCIDRFTGLRISKIIMETQHCYMPGLINVDNKYLIGFWQSENYFKVYRKELLHEFSFDNIQLSDINQKLKNEILRQKNPVAIHIRGGDYTKAENRKIYGNICTSEYYKRAIEYMENRLDEATYYLFTNDSAWSSKILDMEGMNIRIVDWNQENDSIVDMYMMSICKHNIIANSSFSWWGAWLNQNTDKIVVAPKIWQNGIDISDIVPKEWIRI